MWYVKWGLNISRPEGNNILWAQVIQVIAGSWFNKILLNLVRYFVDSIHFFLFIFIPHILLHVNRLNRVFFLVYLKLSTMNPWYIAIKKKLLKIHSTIPLCLHDTHKKRDYWTPNTQWKFKLSFHSSGSHQKNFFICRINSSDCKQLFCHIILFKWDWQEEIYPERWPWIWYYYHIMIYLQNVGIIRQLFLQKYLLPVRIFIIVITHCMGLTLLMK